MRRGLQILLTLVGVVMVVAGTATLITGADKVLDGGNPSASLDSELRFFAAWYLVLGVFLLREVARVESATLIVRVVGIGFFLAACGRALSWLQSGRPHTLYVVLMVIEFLIPVIIIPWQAAVARGPRTQEVGAA